MQSNEWCPLQEVPPPASDSMDMTAWWKNTTQPTSCSENRGTACQQRTATLTTHDLSFEPEVADLTITSYLTSSPIKDCPPDSHCEEKNDPPLTPIDSYSTPTLITNKTVQTPSPNLSHRSYPSAKPASSCHKHYPPMIVLNELTPRPHSSPTDSTISTPYSMTTRGAEHTLLTQQFSLLELDKLWHKFLRSSLKSKSEEKLLNSNCTRRSASSSPQSSTEGVHEQFESLSLRTPKLVNRSVQTVPNEGSPAILKPTTPLCQANNDRLTVPTPQQAVSFAIPHSPCTPSVTTHNSNTISNHDQSITTHHQPSPTPKRSPVSTSLTITTLSPSSTLSPESSSSSPQPTGTLSLAEAFLLHRPDFVVRSQRREKRVRERRDIRRQQGRPALTPSLYPLRYHAKAPPTPRTPSQRPRDKIDRYQMLQRTRKAWQALPEVRWRVVQEQRRREAETNRLRAKLYQKEVLSRMRRRLRRQK